MTLRRVSARVLIVFVLGLVAALSPLQSAVGQELFSVDSFLDAVDIAPGNGVCATAAGDCTLRAAVQEANAHSGEDEISVGEGVFTLSLSGAGEDAAASGDLDITDDVTISGALFEPTVIDGSGQDRVFHVRGEPAPIVTLETLTITGGGAVGQGAGVLADGDDLELLDVTLDGNAAGSEGGGIYVASGNTEVEGSTFVGNSVVAAGGSGGAIAAVAGLTVGNSTFFNNSSAGSGGALHVADTATVTNATFSTNSAIAGSAVSVASTGDLTLAESILAGNGPCVAQAGGTFTKAGNNLESPGDTCGFSGADDVHADPLLGDLSDNGGFTETMALDSTSPAIDAGSSACSIDDQRGLQRPADGDDDGSAVCDLGAYEYVSEVFGSDISIKFADRSDTFKGGVDATTTDTEEGAGFAPRQAVRPSVCEGSRTVELFKKKDGADKKVGRDKTSSDGRWSLQKDDPQGVFYAVVIEEQLQADDGTIVVCEAAESKALRPPRQ